jgi:hypothetical protein
MDISIQHSKWAAYLIRQAASDSVRSCLDSTGVAVFVPFLATWLAASAVLDRMGQVVIVEILALLLMAVLPVARRWRAVGFKALTEPLCLMSGAFVLYYAFRGLVILFRDFIDRPDAILRADQATHTDLAISLGYAVAGFCLFHLGYRYWKPPISRLQNWSRWSSKKVNRLAIVGGLLACASSVVAIQISGGLHNTLSYFGCLRMVTVGYGYFLLGLGYWGVGFAFLFWDRLNRGKTILVPLLLLLMSNICDAFVGNRSGILATWATGFMIYVFSSRGQKTIRSAVILVSVVVAAVAFALPMARIRDTSCSVVTPNYGAIGADSAAIAQAARTTKVERPTDVVVAAARNYHARNLNQIALSALGEFVALDSFSAIIAAGPKEFPFRYGATYLDALLFVIPRVMWPDKPRSFSYQIGRRLLHTDNFVPPGYIGELYINFYLPGVLLGMYLMGLLLRMAFSCTLSGDPVALTAYSALAPYLVIFMGRDFIGAGPLVLIPAALMLPFIYVLRRPPDTSTADHHH